ncbi:CHASE3 domain-containing protein [Phenylobacterium sp. SCN 70-31]|uniref:CHASE3 domain-containing protein n=1 Tax=Phenylobacterium sp. SCN 70-31 TaxID=1660129 RepID=UPI00086AEA74|nr:CHASE3 domain-containing protein [Phenylobacterium sp. SCN 70-31]ODT89356.1 MAG: histidine kinase [Phenylobacterium sp. SCN 70-31]
MRPVRTDRPLFALLSGFAVLVVIVATTLWLGEQQSRSERLVQHTLAVEMRLASVLSIVQDAETGQRGFLLTEDVGFLAPYRRAIAVLDEELQILAASISDNPSQQAEMAALKSAIRTRMDLLTLKVEGHRPGEAGASLLAALVKGRAAMDQVREIILRMQAEEATLLERRVERSGRQALLVRGGQLLAAALVVLLGAFVFADGRRRLRATETARGSLEKANADLKAEIAQREAAEAQVRQFQKVQAIGQLTGGIAHDFNNMLAIVIGSLDLAKRRLTSDPQKAEACIDNALEGADRAAQLTSRLLAFSRQQPLAPRVLDVNKLVGGMSELLRRTIGENLRVETVLAGGLWRTFADPAQLENAIVNLCVNGRDAMPEGGKLTIETTNTHLDDAYAAANAEVAAGQYVMISVTDTGSGMPPEVIERAFDPFYTTKGVGRGTGLGLSQVHGFVKQSRGHVKIYSEPGVGTTIKIYLPRNAGEPSAQDNAPRPLGELPQARDGEVVLVVEDDERVRRLSVDALRELGYTVAQAADAAQAMTVLGLQARVDLLFTDVVMPDLDGRRLADRAREARPDLKVLYTTGYTRNAIVHNGMLDADVAFLAKPFTVEQLALKVRQVLDEETVGRNA